jgi:SAM-dependent methyltransferase
MNLKSPRFSRNLINFLRAFRNYMYVGLSPIDYISRVINNKKNLPPLYLRRYVGPLRSFESSGAEFRSYLQLLAELKPSDSVLDIGCGCGMMGIYLQEYLNETGYYTGVDISRSAIKWPHKNITGKYPNFKFLHIDINNLTYNPKGKLNAENFIFPFKDASFDIILLKSVFTHLRPAQVENYLKEIARLLKKGGRCLGTFFLLNDEQQALDRQGRNKLKFLFGEGEWRYVYEHSPESAMAFDERYILNLLEKNGLALKNSIYYGKWSGRSGLSDQDIIVFEKK